MYIYIVLYLIGTGLFQLWQYRTWKSAQREKQVFAWLRLGRMYLPVFFLPIVCILPIPSLLKCFYVLFLLLVFALDIRLHFYFAKGCRNFLLALRPDSRIIIQGLHSTGEPWNPYYKYLNLCFILVSALIKHPLVMQQENYLIVHDILAFAFREDIASHQIYLYLYQDMIPSFLRRKEEFWKREAELYLINPGKNSAIKDGCLPFPADRIRCLDADDALLFPQCLIRIIEDDSGLREKVESALSPYKTCRSTDPGKRYLVQMICQSLEKRRSVTEYFYELMKLAEFMIHYRSLADYEKASQKYFDSGAPIAMGTFQDGIVDSEPCEPQEREAYIQALKYLNQLCTGKEGSVNRRKLMAEGRQKLVMVRNHFIGHGSLSYGISTEFVKQLLTVTAGQIADFSHLPDPVIKQLHIRDIPKIREQEDRLYLLIQLEAGSACCYLDHSSGKFLTQMQ